MIKWNLFSTQLIQNKINKIQSSTNNKLLNQKIKYKISNKTIKKRKTKSNNITNNNLSYKKLMNY